MCYSTKDRVTVCFILLVLLAGIAILTNSSQADEPKPSKEDYQNLEDIKSNQKVLEKNREAYNRFMEAKRWNEEEVRQLNANGWNVDWETMELVPMTHVVETAHAAAPSPSKQSDGKLWAWDGAPAYKNDRLRAYQRMLKDRGVTDKEHLKLLTAQLIQEAGSLSETTIGDNGCSVGILQYNACVHHKMNGKRFLETHPEWKNWEYQLERMADMVAERMKIYDGDIRLVVIHHNGPAFARRGVDTPAGYYKSVASRTSLLSSL